MEHEVVSALAAFTQRYVACWQQEKGHLPASEALYGIASPCIVENHEDAVYWLPQPFVPSTALNGVERALEISLHPDVHAFYTTQYAGDMAAQCGSLSCQLLQVWSEEDFIRMQENLIGHLLTQKRLKLTPTLFLATTDSEMSMVSLCNVSGEVVLEEFGTKKRQTLAPTLAAFLSGLNPLAV
ncbi:SecY-interacting protein [Pectobacterium wasabiae]|uniref:Protein Syd n=1 Tax=Pectobacterium wasabiae TaxID=55208 RepID=A0AAW3ENH6_9GAMM|nr:SecY-interacting protein [Pectobacterium wasabiae]AOR64317.1 SecY-interacting protein [Pectobacterium wasabiae CFBP 3304]EJS92412.1 Syd family protein [Pectobacterium wasabiae CFBP 3304]KFX09194.1 secretion protein [Pectobacterium wasabiae]KGA29301.1 secretion protein [Pectobacterium wasabiae]